MDERERRRQRRYREAMRNRVIAVVFLAALIVGIVFIVKGCRDKKQVEEERRQQAAEALAQQNTQKEPASAKPSAANNELLTLVNPWNPLPDDWTVDLVTLDDGHRVDSRCYIVDDQSMIAMVACGRGFAIMPELMFKTGTDPHGCQVLRLEPAATRSIGLACLARGALSPAARQFAAKVSGGAGKTDLC